MNIIFVSFVLFLVKVKELINKDDKGESKQLIIIGSTCSKWC